jgi:hypothetical protein
MNTLTARPFRFRSMIVSGLFTLIFLDQPCPMPWARA